MIHLVKCPRTTPLWGTLVSTLQVFDDKTPSIREISPVERAIIFGIQNNSLALLPTTTRAAFCHAWQALYRNLTLVDVKGVPFSLDRVVYEALTALVDVARRLAKAHVIAICRWNGEANTEPKLHHSANTFL